MTESLELDSRIEQPDDFYEELIRLHDGLTEEQSRDVNTRLILILSNHIGDKNVLSEAFHLARKGV